MFDGVAIKVVAPVAGTYVVPTGMRARLLKGASTVIRGPAQTKAVTEGVIEFTTMLALEAYDEVRLQVYFSGADGHAAQDLTGMWGHLVE